MTPGRHRDTPPGGVAAPGVVDMTTSQTYRIAGAILATVGLAWAGAGCGTADEVASPKPTASNLGRFLLAGSDLPDGYKAADRTRSSSPGSCVNFGGNRTAARFNEKKLGALGFKRCATNYFRKHVHTFLASFASERHSLPVSGLGDEAPRGIEFTFFAFDLR